MSEKMERLNPLSDSVFGYMFSDQALKPSLLELINSVLRSAGDTQIEDVQEFKTQYDVQKRLPDTHGGRVDVRAKATDGALFDIEVQLHAEKAMNARSWFYGSGLMSEEFSAGKPYNRIPKVRIINLLDFELRENHPDFLQPVKLLYVKEPEEATDAFRIYNIELPKFRAKYTDLASVKDDPLLCWLYLLDKGYASEHEMKELSAMTDGMRAFAAKYNVSLADPMLKDMYEYEQSAKRDYASAMEQSRNEGINIGIGKGIDIGIGKGIDIGKGKGQETMIRKLWKNGASKELIYRSTDLPAAEVDAIIAEQE